MPIRENSPEVLVALDDVVEIAGPDVLALGRRTAESPRRRSRLCAHRDPAETLHEMFICLEQDTYIGPHKHAGKVESFHIVQGEADVLIFSEEGRIQQVVSLGEFRSERP